MIVTKNKKLINDIVRINVLEEELEYYRSLVRDHRALTTITTIDSLKKRIEELRGE
tara:strand:+ start:957 stop:1124 length:168 start_codon:yes stop_codon:yes gene_type:complete